LRNTDRGGDTTLHRSITAAHKKTEMRVAAPIHRAAFKVMAIIG
jgi:hypothetical protein